MRYTGGQSLMEEVLEIVHCERATLKQHVPVRAVVIHERRVSSLSHQDRIFHVTSVPVTIYKRKHGEEFRGRKNQISVGIYNHIVIIVMQGNTMENRLENAVYSRNVIKFPTQALRRQRQAFIIADGVCVQPRVAIQGVSDEAYDPNVSKGSGGFTGSE
jgi:hypothetical protein